MTIPQRILSIAWLLAPVAFVACHATPAADVAIDAERLPAADGEFPAPRELLRGFDGRQRDGDWRVGDEVLFGLRLQKGDSLRHWLLKLRLLEPLALDADGEPVAEVDWYLRINGGIEHFRTAQCLVEVVVMDEHGNELGRSEPRLPRDFLDYGIARGCERAGPVGYRSQAEDAEAAFARSTVCAVSLLEVVQADSVLAPLLWEVIERPSIWSVVSNLGARVVLRPRFHRVDRVLPPLRGIYDPTWRLPMNLLVNQQPALDLDLFVADAAPPFALCGGLLSATARHPSRPGLQFSLQLLSARRGPSR